MVLQQSSQNVNLIVGHIFWGVPGSTHTSTFSACIPHPLLCLYRGGFGADANPICAPMRGGKSRNKRHFVFPWFACRRKETYLFQTKVFCRNLFCAWELFRAGTQCERMSWVLVDRDSYLVQILILPKERFDLFSFIDRLNPIWLFLAFFPAWNAYITNTLVGKNREKHLARLSDKSIVFQTRVFRQQFFFFLCLKKS